MRLPGQFKMRFTGHLNANTHSPVVKLSHSLFREIREQRYTVIVDYKW